MAGSHTVLTRRYALPLAQPLTTARGQWTAHTGTLVGWCQDGRTAWACAPDLPQWPQHAAAVRSFAEDLARLQWFADRESRPLPQHLAREFGLVAREKVPLAATMDTQQAALPATASWLRETGMAHLKVKVGADCTADAVDQWLRPLLAAVPNLAVRLDANQAWDGRSPDDLQRLLTQLAEIGIASIEDPVSFGQWPATSPLPLAADLLQTPPDPLIALARAGQIQFAVIKPALCNTVGAFVQLSKILADCGVNVVVSSCFEPPLGLAQLAALAALVPGHDVGHGIATHMLLPPTLARTMPASRGGQWTMRQLWTDEGAQSWSVIWPDLVEQAALDRPDAPAMRAGDTTWAWAALAQAVGERARQLGRTPQLPFAVVQALNSPQLVVDLWANWRLRRCAVLLHPAWTQLESDALVERVPAVLQSHDNSDPLLAIVATSGTTGTPKLVALTHRNLAAAAFAYWQRSPPGDDERWLACLPLCHVAGLALLWRAAAGRIELVLSDGDTASIARTLRDHPCTTASLVPTQLARLLGADVAPGRLRAVIVGGASLDPELHARALAAGWPVLPTWGMTETCAMAALGAVGQPPQARNGLHLVGPALPGLELAIASDADQGEILVRGDQVAGTPGQWFATSDHGHLDGQGNLWVASRRADRIIRGGENIDPLEIEAVLLRVPGVQEAAVVGVPHATLGQEVAAWVVGDGLTSQALQGALTQLAPFKRPTRWHLTPEPLPRNAMGKLQRNVVVAALGSAAPMGHRPH